MLQNYDGADVNLYSQFGGMGGANPPMLHDAVGNLTSMKSTVTRTPAYSGQTNYTCDGAGVPTNSKNQLVQETSTRTPIGYPSGYTNNNAYDPAFNPTQLRSVNLPGGASYNADNQLVSGVSYVYDGNGNPTTYKGAAYGYDAENRLTSIGSLLTAGYTSEGLRAWKQNSSTGVQTYFLYDGDNPVCELNSSGVVVATNTFGEAGLAARHTSAGSYEYLFDPQGNVAERLEPGGSVSDFLFDAFGSRSGNDTVGDPYAGFGGKWGYYTDVETGLQLLGHRYYDSGTGRFINRDPIGYDGGINLYAYCGNSSVSNVDPSGLFNIDISIGADGFGTGRIYTDEGDILPDCKGRPDLSMGPFPHGMPVGPRFGVGNTSSTADPNQNNGHGPFPPGQWPIKGIIPTHPESRASMGDNVISIGGPNTVPGIRLTRIHTGRGGYHHHTNGCLRIDDVEMDYIMQLIDLNPHAHPGGPDNRITVIYNPPLSSRHHR